MANKEKKENVPLRSGDLAADLEAEFLGPVAQGSTGFSDKPLKAVFDGMKESQSRFYDSHDSDTEFLLKALDKAESAEERSKIRQDFIARDKEKIDIAKMNIGVWRYAIGAVMVVGVALITRSSTAAASAAAKLLKP